jgi:hypothetical protein
VVDSRGERHDRKRKGVGLVRLKTIFARMRDAVWNRYEGTREEKKKTVVDDCKMENGYSTVFIQTSDGQHRRFEFGWLATATGRSRRIR